MGVRGALGVANSYVDIREYEERAKHCGLRYNEPLFGVFCARCARGR